MKTKNITIPLRLRSADGDFICTNGELDSFSGLIPRLSPEYPVPTDDSLSQPPSSDEELSVSAPPAPDIEFNLLRTCLPGWHVHPSALPTRILQDTPSARTAAQFLNLLVDTAAGNNLFIEPFLIIAAYRLSDGNYISPTPPVLMIPNSEAPVVANISENDNECRLAATAAICRLQLRTPAITLPEDWLSFISSLDILISAPLHLFDCNGAFSSVSRIKFDGFTHSQSTEGTAGELPVYEDTITAGWQPQNISSHEISRLISSMDTFHLISSIPISQISAGSSFNDVAFNCAGTPLSSPYPSYRPDYLHLSSIEVAGKATFSGRDTLFNLTITPPSFLPLRRAAPYCNIAGYIPRFIFHPDPEATAYPVASSVLPLRRHPSLYGAIMVRPFDELNLATPSPSPCFPTTRHFPGAILRSTKGLRLLFPDSLLISSDAGVIIAIARAFRSSGLVATTAPTAYLFTSEGVFLLRESDDGNFKDAGLISRHVLKDTASIYQYPDHTDFLTENGELIRIEGTKASSVEAIAAKTGKVTLSALGGGIYLYTRPLKLSDNPVPLLAVSVQGNCMASAVRTTLEGSHDLRVWHPLASVAGLSVNRLWGAAYPFFRLSLEGEMQKGDTLCAITAKILQ